MRTEMVGSRWRWSSRWLGFCAGLSWESSRQGCPCWSSGWAWCVWPDHTSPAEAGDRPTTWASVPAPTLTSHAGGPRGGSTVWRSSFRFCAITMSWRKEYPRCINICWVIKSAIGSTSWNRARAPSGRCAWFALHDKHPIQTPIPTHPHTHTCTNTHTHAHT